MHFKSRLSKNLLAGVASSAWAAALAIVVIPVYLRYLGIEAYGLIGFFTMLQVSLQVLDFGIASTINREVARWVAQRNPKGAANLLSTLSTIYWLIAIAIGAALCTAAPYVAAHWLEPKQVPARTVLEALILMALVIALRWPTGLYVGVLLGAGRATKSSCISVVSVSLGSLGAIAVLKFVAPSITAFFAWQGIVGLLTAFMMQRAAWQTIGGRAGAHFNVAEVARVWRFSAGVAAITFSGLAFTQLDKAILSKVVSLDEFGRYMLAVAVAGAVAIVIEPVFNVIYPRFSSLIASGRTQDLTLLYRSGTRLLAGLLFPAAAAVALLSKELVYLWIGDMDIANSVAPIISILTIGSALHGVMHFPYALQLAHGMTRIPLQINLTLIVFMVPLLIFFAISYGALGGALAWISLQVAYMILGTWMTHRHILRNIGWKWLSHDVGIPLAFASTLFLVGFHLFDGAGFSERIKIAGIATLTLITCLAPFAISPDLVRLIRGTLTIADHKTVSDPTQNDYQTPQLPSKSD